MSGPPRSSLGPPALTRHLAIDTLPPPERPAQLNLRGTRYGECRCGKLRHEHAFESRQQGDESETQRALSRRVAVSTIQRVWRRTLHKRRLRAGSEKGRGLGQVWPWDSLDPSSSSIDIVGPLFSYLDDWVTPDDTVDTRPELGADAAPPQGAGEEELVGASPSYDPAMSVLPTHHLEACLLW